MPDDDDRSLPRKLRPIWAPIVLLAVAAFVVYILAHLG